MTAKDYLRYGDVTSYPEPPTWVRMASLGSMQLRHLLAVGLSALLLSVSSWASVCELSCSLSHAYPAPKLTPGSSATQAHEASTPEINAPDSHCGHARTARPRNVADHSFEATSHCTNAPCVQGQTLLSSVNGRDGARPEGVQHFVPVAPVPVAASNISFGSAKRERVLPKLPSLDPLSTSLRI